MKVLASFVVLALLLVPTTVAAGPFDVYGAGQRGMAMGAQTAKGSGGFSLTYNPALLVSAEPGVQVGGFASFSNVRIIGADRPDGYDRTDRDLTSSPTDVEGGDPLYGVMFATNIETFIDGLHFGAAIFLPTNELMKLNTRFPDEREANSTGELSFELIGDRVHRPDIQLATAYEITDWLQVGVGGLFIPGATVLTDVYLDDPSNQEDIDLNAFVSTKTRWGFIFGALFQIVDSFSAGLSFRSATSFGIEGENVIKIKGIDEEGDTRQSIDWLPLYSPAQARAGISWETGTMTWAIDWNYTLWSSYRNTHNEPTDFRDTVSGSLGIEYAYSEKTRVRAGLGFEPTPIPEQIDRTNYVDNSRATARLGSAHKLSLGDRDVGLSWSAQAHLLVPRSHTKRVLSDVPDCASSTPLLCDEQPDEEEDPVSGETVVGEPGLQTSNPGFPGFASGGWFAGVSAEVSF